MSNITCQEITSNLQQIKTLRHKLSLAMKEENINKAKELREELKIKIAELNEKTWPFERLLGKEEVKEQYNEMVNTLRISGILEQLQNGQEGIAGIDGKQYPIPSMKTVFREMREKREILQTKIEQGFNKLLLVPFGKSLDGLVEALGERLKVHYKEGKLHGTGGTSQQINEIEQIQMRNEYRDADKNGKLIYEPKRYAIENHDGKTKSEILSESSNTPGWQVLMTEDLPDIPRKGRGKEIAGRRQLEAGKSPDDYLTIQLTNPIYSNETFFNPEAWLTYFLHHLELKDKVVDDWEVSGSIRYLGAVYFPSENMTMYGCWRSGNHQVHLSSAHQLLAYDYCGTAAAVRIT